ncbi:uncharacterized protein LOC121381011 isoform X2 [Gigantopelta aegis]|uniref:uncharacterized protein LOC121381011 isoform X2 n=1 Tax=Gigantopelta aegis TaxID=1735272 RepID=UPI001B88B950|nr:uncharacterized protein LOC121381011 isoform X2 [Gigantopelta aegis]
MSDLISAAKNGYSRHVETFLESGSSVNVTDKDNATALYWAACLGHQQICETLLKARCNVNAQVKWGSTALHAACDRGHADCVRLLINWKAQLDIQNKRGDTPLHLGAYRGFLDIVDILLKACADPLIKNSSSKTPLQEALSRGHTQIANLLNKYTNDFQQFSSLPEIKPSSGLVDSTSHSPLTSWPQCCKSVDSSFVPNIYVGSNDIHSSVLQKNTAITKQDRNRHPVNSPNPLSCVCDNYGKIMEQQESFEDESVVHNGNVSNKENLDEVDGPVLRSSVVDRSNGIPSTLYPLAGCGYSYNNESLSVPLAFHQGLDSQQIQIRPSDMMVTHNHPVPQRTINQSSEAIENYAESLQLELVKYHEIVTNIEKEKCKLEHQISELIHLLQMKEKEIQNVKQLLMKERLLRQQQYRKHIQNEEQRQQLSLAVMSRGQTSVGGNGVTHEHLRKFVNLLYQNSNRCDTGKMVASLQMQLKELWMNSGANVKLDADNEEWIMGKDYELICDHPINQISEGIRNGSCSLIFQIKRRGKPYILKMMINLINMDFDQHSDGYSLDGHLIRNFGMEYHVPLLLDKYPNIIKVLHHYQGSTENFLQFQNLLIPHNLDVPIEMARRTTFIVMETFPQTLQSFMVTQRTACPEPSFGLPDLFLLNLLYQLLEVLCVLQDMRIVHRDIKGDNVFLDKCLRPVLGDFGFARSLRNRDGGNLPFSDHSQACAGNAHAWAPEVSRFNRTLPGSLPYSVSLDQIYLKSDIFAVGRMFYALLSPVIDDNSFPHSSVDQPHYEESAIPELPSVLGVGLRYILKQMVLDEPENRPTPRQALLRVGMLIINPAGEELLSSDDVVPYCQARMLKLLALCPWKSSVPENVLTIDESVRWISPETEASFFVNISPTEFWDTLVDLRRANLLPKAEVFGI